METMDTGRTICLCHDTERGWGHLDVDPGYAEHANRRAPRDLDTMLEIEKESGVILTYHVVGCFLGEIREKLEAGGHCVAFHSYDHDLAAEQLQKCRAVDSDLKGYRAPRNLLTDELNEENLKRHGFEWIASSASAFGFKAPTLENGIVKMPVLLDDFSLYKARLPYEQWERHALKQVRENAFVAICLHDCYAQFWLPHYRTFLARISALAQLKTFDEVAADVRLAAVKGSGT
jgi:hypothetical protein